MYNWITLLFTWNSHNIVSQIYVNKKKFTWTVHRAGGGCPVTLILQLMFQGTEKERDLSKHTQLILGILSPFRPPKTQDWVGTVVNERPPCAGVKGASPLSWCLVGISSGSCKLFWCCRRSWKSRINIQTIHWKLHSTPIGLPDKIFLID